MISTDPNKWAIAKKIIFSSNTYEHLFLYYKSTTAQVEHEDLPNLQQVQGRRVLGQQAHYTWQREEAVTS